MVEPISLGTCRSRPSRARPNYGVHPNWGTWQGRYEIFNTLAYPVSAASRGQGSYRRPDFHSPGADHQPRAKRTSRYSVVTALDKGIEGRVDDPLERYRQQNSHVVIGKR
jgi:hypothetical protein